MQFAGVLPDDAPDPRIEASQRLLGLPFPLLGLTPQPTLEEIDHPAIAEGTDAEGRFQLAVSWSYTLWRNPEDRADPVNLVHLSEYEQVAIDDAPPWPRPPWLIEYVEMMRYPRVGEAVRTSWNRDCSEHTTLTHQLVDHTNYILMNQFREELGLAPGPTGDGSWQVRHSSVNSSARVELDGNSVPAFEIDTNPFVYAIGAQIRQDVVVTVVIAREHLPYISLSLQTRTPATS